MLECVLSTIPYGECSEIKDKMNVAYLDYSKAYLKMLLNLKKLPVYNFAERFRKYDSHEIKNFNLYKIQVNDKDDLFNTSITLIYGFNLRDLELKYEILEYIEPSYLKSNNKCEKLFEQLYSTELDIKHKKNIGNVLIGF